jgi:hypothetical protein
MSLSLLENDAVINGQRIRRIHIFQTHGDIRGPIRAQ